MHAIAILLSLSLAAPPDAIGPQPTPDTCAPKVRSVLAASRAELIEADRRTSAALARAARLEHDLEDAQQDRTTTTAWAVIGGIAGGLLVGALAAGLAVKYGGD